MLVMRIHLLKELKPNCLIRRTLLLKHCRGEVKPWCQYQQLDCSSYQEWCYNVTVVTRKLPLNTPLNFTQCIALMCCIYYFTSMCCLIVLPKSIVCSYCLNVLCVLLEWIVKIFKEVDEQSSVVTTTTTTTMMMMMMMIAECRWWLP